MGIYGYMKHMKTKLELLGLDNLIWNIYTALNGKISKGEHKLRESFSETSNWLLYTKSIY